MSPSARSDRVSAPPDRVYNSVSPLAQAQFPPRRQRVYGRRRSGVPLIKKKQGTLTQIGFITPEKIDDEIAEYEREEKRRKVETPRTKGGLRAKPVIGQRDAPMSGSRLRQVMDNKEERGGSVVMHQKQEEHDVPVQRLDDTPEPSLNGEPRPKRRRKSRKGIKIGVKIVTIKIETPEVERQATQAHHREDETQRGDIEMVMDSFRAAPSFEEERNFKSHLRVEGEREEEVERRRNRVIPDSDAESEHEEIVYDSNDEGKADDDIVPDLHHQPDEPQDKPQDAAGANAGSVVDLDEIEDLGGRHAGSENDLDELQNAAHEDAGEIDLDLTREIPDSQAESEDDENPDVDVIRDSQHARVPTLKEEATLILNSFFLPSTGEPAVQPRLRVENGPNIIPDSFSVLGSQSTRPQPVLVADSFYHAAPADGRPPPLPQPAPPPLSTVPEEENVDVVPSSSAVSTRDVQADIVSMPPPETPTKPRRTEVPNTGSTGSTISTQSTIRSMTPSSARSKIYNRSPSKTYNRSPLKKLSEDNVLQGASLTLSRLSQSPSKRSILPALRESQVSTQGTPTQRIRISQLSSFIKPELETRAAAVVEPEEEDEPTIIPDSPATVRMMTPKAERNDSQCTADTNSPSRQIHSELSATLNSDPQPPSSRRTVRFIGKVAKDSQADSDDDEEEVFVPSSPRPVTPRMVRFQSIPEGIPSSPHVPRSSPATAGTDTQASSSKPPIVGADTQMRSQWLGSDDPSSGPVGETQGTLLGESQWLSDLLPESLMMDGMEQLSVPPILDDDSVWDEFGSRKSSIED